MKIIGHIAAFFILIVLGSLMKGWALSELWEWFILPTFNAPRLSIVNAIGISILVSFLTLQVDSAKQPDTELFDTYIKSFVYGVIYPLIVVFIGWIVTFFM